MRTMLRASKLCRCMLLCMYIWYRRGSTNTYSPIFNDFVRYTAKIGSISQSINEQINEFNGMK